MVGVFIMNEMVVFVKVFFNIYCLKVVLNVFICFFFVFLLSVNFRYVYFFCMCYMCLLCYGEWFDWVCLFLLSLFFVCLYWVCFFVMCVICFLLLSFILFKFLFFLRKKFYFVFEILFFWCMILLYSMNENISLFFLNRFLK